MIYSSCICLPGIKETVLCLQIGDACWKGVEKALCADNSDQPSILV